MAYKNIEPKVAAVNANSVCRQMSQNTAEQEFAAPDEFVAEVQWSMAIRKLIAGLEFGDQQTNARLWRQGQTQVVTIHHIITKDTVDEDVMAALEQKDMTQEKLISAVKARLEA